LQNKNGRLKYVTSTKDNKGKHMDITSKIIQEAGFACKNNTELRKGQALMNALFENNRLVYDWISGTVYDPFYDDHRLTAFFGKLNDYFG